jgi:hypothetical protein
MSNENFDNQILKNMSDKKQTAIEWLINEWPILKSNLPIWLIEQAKEMEKQQIAEAYWNGSDGIEDKNSILKIGIEYYNDTYQL